MNLHEECLLKYLKNPMDLFFSTDELIKMNDLLMEQECMKKQIIEANKNINCTL